MKLVIRRRVILINVSGWSREKARKGTEGKTSTTAGSFVDNGINCVVYGSSLFSFYPSRMERETRPFSPATFCFFVTATAVLKEGGTMNADKSVRHSKKGRNGRGCTRNEELRGKKETKRCGEWRKMDR